MSTSSWSRLKAAALRKLTDACPILVDRRFDTLLDASVTIVALADVHLTVRPIENRLEADIRAKPSLRGDALALNLLEQIVHVVSEHASRSRPDNGVDFDGWLAGCGFTDLMADLLSRDADEDELIAIADIVAAAVKSLVGTVTRLSTTHLEDILARDLPQALSLRRNLTSMAEWLLAPETSGTSERMEILKRRLQAANLYGALSQTLRRSNITSVVDDGRPLAAALMAAHDLSQAELRCLRESRRVRHTIESSTDFHDALEELKAHCVPLSEWPGDGRPAQPEAWEGSIWLKMPRSHIVRPDYAGPEFPGVQDALTALKSDLLRPLVSDRVRAAGLPRTGQVDQFARSIELNGAGGGGTARKEFLTALRQAIVGPRGPKAFGEAVALWHRRAASLAALRHERQADRPGWPPLCAPWRSDCGDYEVMALASAEDLVEEGNQLDHCVGGYYEICRRGDTQILSLRHRGSHVATAEINLQGDIEAPDLKVGQFHARRNTPPAPHLHDALRSFLRAVRSGAHPMNAVKIARYRRRMQRTWDGVWRTDALGLDHARETFPFYRAMLPRSSPITFDDWCRDTGLLAAVDLALSRLVTASAATIDDSIPR